MTAQEILDVCLAKPGAYLDCPFGPEPVCARVGKRIFAEAYLTRPWVTFACEPLYGMAMRETYPEVVRRGYHCPAAQQPYRNTVTLNGAVPDDRLLEMIDHSYARALATLTRTQRADALARTPEMPSGSGR